MRNIEDLDVFPGFRRWRQHDYLAAWHLESDSRDGASRRARPEGSRLGPADAVRTETAGARTVSCSVGAGGCAGREVANHYSVAGLVTLIDGTRGFAVEHPDSLRAGISESLLPKAVNR